MQRIFLYGPVPPDDIVLFRFLCRLSPPVLLSSVACCLSRISGSRSFSTFLALADRVPPDFLALADRSGTAFIALAYRAATDFIALAYRSVADFLALADRSAAPFSH